MDRKDGFDFCLGPLVFKGRLDEAGKIASVQRDLGPFGSNLDELKGRTYDGDLKAEMIRAGFERVKQFADEYREHAAKHGVTI